MRVRLEPLRSRLSPRCLAQDLRLLNELRATMSEGVSRRVQTATDGPQPCELLAALLTGVCAYQRQHLVVPLCVAVLTGPICAAAGNGHRHPRPTPPKPWRRVCCLAAL